MSTTIYLASAMFSNDTDLKGDLGYNLDILSASLDLDYLSGFRVELPHCSGPIWDLDCEGGGTFPVYSDLVTVSGTLYEGGGQVNVATVGIYDETFTADFGSQQVSFTA
jgi:hypothetical protein